MAKKEYKYTPAPGADEFSMVPVEIDRSEEQWTKVYLADGTVLKVRIIVVKAGRSIDKPAPGSNGEPLYHVQSGTVVVADVPDNLRFDVEE